jgi:hypothetical protein
MDAEPLGICFWRGKRREAGLKRTTFEECGLHLSAFWDFAAGLLSLETPV